MRIGVVSDTHSKKLPQQMIDDFKKVDFIIHVGDFCDINDYQAMARINKIEAVYGNMDSTQVTKLLCEKRILSCGGFHIGLMHGRGPGRAVIYKVQEAFKDDKVDAIIFGHSHHPFNEKINGILYFNPGSPTDEIFAPYCSYGILDVTEAGIKGHIIKLGYDK